MKKKIYPLISMLLAIVCQTSAQYHITSLIRLDTLPHVLCNDSELFYLQTDIPTTIPGADSNYHVKFYFGDGTIWNYSFLPGSVSLRIPHNYLFPGRYRIKAVLIKDTLITGPVHTDIDSMVKDNDFTTLCQSMPIGIYYDASGTGVYDSVDKFIQFPVRVQVSKNGIPVDTLSCTSGFYYRAFGITGDIFSFKIIGLPAGLVTSGPVGGVINDTVSILPSNYKVNLFGVRCGSAASFDLRVHAVIPVTGIHDQWGNIYVENYSCPSTDAVVTLNFSPKYSAFASDDQPFPSSLSGNTLTWDFTGLSVTMATQRIYYVLWDVAGLLASGDTVQEHITVTPVSGDANPSNNVQVVIDTVRAGCDPNEMWVNPTDTINAGDQLKYIISFENTGNDTAFNISVYDTLPDYVDVNSLNLELASAKMNIAILNQAGHNIIKFDFPNINLLDSSHHNECNGTVIFTLKTLEGILPGTAIYNHAGIFFDYNPVVLTNTVKNIVRFTSGITDQHNSIKTKLYPNPAENELMITTNKDTYNSVSITTIMGRTMLISVIKDNDSKLDIQTLPAGSYFVTLSGEGGKQVLPFVKM